MSKYGKRILAAGMCASMAMGLLTGCSSSNDEVVAKMGDTKLTLGEANFMLRYSQAQTQSYLGAMFGEGTNVFQQDLTGSGQAYGETVKESVLNDLKDMTILEQHMSDYNVELTDEDKAAIEEAAKQFIADNSKDVLKEMSATEETVSRILTLYTIQSKMETAIEADVDTEVSDEEAAQKTIQYAYFTIPETESETEDATEATSADESASETETETEATSKSETVAETETEATSETEAASEAASEETSEDTTESETEESAEKKETRETVQGIIDAVQGGETLEDAGMLCLKAGMDMELPNPSGFGEKFLEKFRTGKADISVLNRAVLRVLTAKFRMGLFEHPFSLHGEELKGVFSQKTDREVSLQSAKESLVLLKNNGVLPIGSDVKKIAVIGPHADCARKFFGGYTHMCMMESTYAIANSIAGVSGVKVAKPEEIKTVPGTNIQSDETEEFDQILRRQKPDCRSLLEELREKLPDVEVSYSYGYYIAGEDESHFEEALEKIKEADLVILTLGGKHGTCSMSSMGEGVDGSNINLPKGQDEFIKRAAAFGKPMVGVHFDGRPISSDIADKYLDGILEAWSPAETGAEAVVSVLLGEYNPGGKMPVTTAYHAGQIPVYYNHQYNSCWDQVGSIGFANYVDLPHTPRYCFGHGLSYTQFSYSKKEIGPFETIEIRVDVENVGSRAGDEVVQLYLRDLYASMARPVKELAGFKRITLEPGEKQTVIFEVKASQMAFLDMNMQWKVEKGTFLVEVGSSSQDIRLKDEYKVTEDGWLEGTDRGFYAKAYKEADRT